MRNSFLGRICLFLENHSLEFNEIWHESTLGNEKLEYLKKRWTLTAEILGISVNLQQGIIEDLYVKHVKLV